MRGNVPGRSALRLTLRTESEDRAGRKMSAPIRVRHLRGLRCAPREPSELHGALDVSCVMSQQLSRASKERGVEKSFF